ncbi:hypothetical protein [Gaiella sp.]|uniref:hypothetical protein n=1 Tax=Gaiella sp. TaxID=2663207 RepID=UPI0039839855
MSAVLTEQAMAKKSCAQQVIADWFDDGRVNRIYPLPCYAQAIKQLPPDLLIYGNAEEEIGRALAFAKQGKPDPGGKDPTPTTPVETKTTETKNTETDTTSNVETETSETDTTATDTSGPSSVPIPLLVLGGLAILLLAAGSAGYLRRRMNGDGDDDGSAAPPPAV